MFISKLFKLAILPSVLFASVSAFGHGLIESPPSRAYVCGVVTKPDQVNNPTAQYPECAGAFATNETGSYNFMSVLTHARGRLRPLPDLPEGVTAPANESDGETPPLAQNVCGYDAETFNNGATPWDQLIDWPTQIMQAGRNKIVWNISWGPHFDDTQEFHYWITKADFDFKVNSALTWDDFEEQPFCQLGYDHSQPDANPDVNALVDSAKFETYCEVPERDGRHVIYGEWGRNYFTWERFHSCVDAVFGSDTAVIAANIDLGTTIALNGTDIISVDGSQSTGDDLIYLWSILGQTTDASYSFNNVSSALTTLTFTNPSANGTVNIALTVTSGDESTSVSTELVHTIQGAISQWTVSKTLVDTATTLNSGDSIQLRLVSNNGVDTYIPSPAFTITDDNADAAIWPIEFAQVINDLNAGVAIGILDSSDVVIPQSSANTNLIYVETGANIASVFLNITDAVPPVTGTNNCVYSIDSEWETGFTGKIKITNTSDAAINGWEVNWSYDDGTIITQLWNANSSGSYSASNLSWNSTIQVNESVEFGFIGNKGGSTASTPSVTGIVCN